MTQLGGLIEITTALMSRFDFQVVPFDKELSADQAWENLDIPDVTIHVIGR